MSLTPKVDGEHQESSFSPKQVAPFLCHACIHQSNEVLSPTSFAAQRKHVSRQVSSKQHGNPGRAP